VRGQGGETFRFERLEVWDRAMAWTRRVYAATASFPPAERFGLTSQLRRAAVSVPSNIAEATGRLSSTEFVRFLEIAYGSLMEAVCQCRLAADLGYLPSEEHATLRSEAVELARMLSGLRAKRQEEAGAR
jgi:four helix bundle protein